MSNKNKIKSIEHLQKELSDRTDGFIKEIFVDRDQTVYNHDIDSDEDDIDFAVDSETASMMKEYKRNENQYSVGTFIRIYARGIVNPSDWDDVKSAYRVPAILTYQETGQSKYKNHGLVDKTIVEESPRKYLIHIDEQNYSEADEGEIKVYYVNLQKVRENIGEIRKTYPYGEQEAKLELGKNDPGVYGIEKLVERLDRKTLGGK